MATIQKFEDLKIWQNSRTLCKEIFQLLKRDYFKRDISLSIQINKSSGSIMDNIAEGFARFGTKELIQYLTISLGSAMECKSQLYRAYDRNYLSENELADFLVKIDEIKSGIISFIKYLKNSNLKGLKFPSPK